MVTLQRSNSLQDDDEEEDDYNLAENNDSK